MGNGAVLWIYGQLGERAERLVTGRMGDQSRGRSKRSPVLSGVTVWGQGQGPATCGQLSCSPSCAGVLRPSLAKPPLVTDHQAHVTLWLHLSVELPVLPTPPQRSGLTPGAQSAPAPSERLWASDQTFLTIRLHSYPGAVVLYLLVVLGFKEIKYVGSLGLPTIH